MLGRGSTRIEELKLGDVVESGSGGKALVHSLGHFEPHSKAEFLQIATTKNAPQKVAVQKKLKFEPMGVDLDKWQAEWLRTVLCDYVFAQLAWLMGSFGFVLSFTKAAATLHFCFGVLSLYYVVLKRIGYSKRSSAANNKGE